MVEPFDESKIAEHLIAFTDGELDAEQLLQIATYVAKHPELLDVIRDQRNLRQATRRVVCANTPPIPAALRARIKQMTGLAEPEKAFAISNRNSAMLRLAKLCVAAAIVLFFGVGIGYFLRAGNSKNQVVTAVSRPAVPAVLIAEVTKVHVDCSRFSPQLHSGPFPTTAPFEGLAGNVEHEFHSKVPYPDLTLIGYSFVGAGPCRKPLNNTVHLLYRSIKPTIHDTLSVFVQPYIGQVQINSGVATLAADQNAPHPMFVWRTDHAVYFLVTDEFKTAEQARDTIQVAFNP